MQFRKNSQIQRESKSFASKNPVRKTGEYATTQHQSFKSNQSKFSLFSSLQARFLVAMILVGVLPFSLMGMTLIRQERQALKDHATQELTLLASIFSEQLDSLLKEYLKDSQAIASLPEIVSMDPERQLPVLRELYEHHYTYGQLAVADIEGQLLVVGRDMPLVSIAHVESFQSAAKGQQDWVIAPTLFNDTLVLHMHTPIRNETDEVIGALGSPVKLASLRQFLDKLGTGVGGRAFLLDESGRVLIHPNVELAEERVSYVDHLQFAAGLAPLDKGFVAYTMDDKKYIAGYAPIPEFGWTIVVERSEASVLAPVERSVNFALGAQAVSFILSLILGLLLARSLTRPVRNLAHAAYALGVGNVREPLPNTARASSEIAQLIQSFGAMRKAVNEREVSLRRSESRQRAMVNAIPDILLRVDLNFQILDAKGPLNLLDIADANQVIGRSIDGLCTTGRLHELCEQIRDGVGRTLQTAQMQIFESNIHADGRYRDFEIRASMSNEFETLVIIREITNRKQAEVEIRRHQSAMAAAIDGMAIIKDGVYLYANEALAQLHGYQGGTELTGQPWGILYPEDERCRIEAEILPRVEADGLWRGETRGQRRDDSTYSQEMSLALIDTGELVSVVRDITQRKQAESALQQAQKMESIGVLAGGIAHDFNNLLTSMMGQTSLAIAKLSNENPARRHIEKAIISAERAADLTRQMLAYAGKGQFYVQELDLNHLIEENASLLDTVLPANATLGLNLSTKLPSIEADRAQIQQVVMNLVINAIESLPKAGGSVHLSTYCINIEEHIFSPLDFIGGEVPADGLYVCMDVRDTGSGMDEAILPRIFDPFYSTKTKGSGLGLAATLGIIQTHRGGIRVESQLRKGSRFQVYFPATGEFVPTELEPILELGTLRGTALVIDDEAAVRETACEVMEAVGMNVRTATNGKEGLAQYQEYAHEIEVILLDMKMPVMDGAQVMTKLKQMNIASNVILTSGYTEAEAASLFVDNQRVFFLQKPYRADTLVEKIQSILGVETKLAHSSDDIQHRRYVALPAR